MASETDPIAPQTWVAIDIAKGVNVALVEHSDGRQQRFRFVVGWALGLSFLLLFSHSQDRSNTAGYLHGSRNHVVAREALM